MRDRSNVTRGGAKRSPSPSPWGVYFVGAGEYLYLRVGVSADVEEELKNLQERTHAPLTILGCIQGEKELFEKFTDFTMGMGWFERSLAMEEFLDGFDEDQGPLLDSIAPGGLR